MQQKRITTDSGLMEWLRSSLLDAVSTVAVSHNKDESYPTKSSNSDSSTTPKAI